MKITIEAMTPEEFFVERATFPTAPSGGLTEYYELKARYYKAFLDIDYDPKSRYFVLPLLNELLEATIHQDIAPTLDPAELENEYTIYDLINAGSQS